MNHRIFRMLSAFDNHPVSPGISGVDFDHLIA